MFTFHEHYSAAVVISRALLSTPGWCPHRRPWKSHSERCLFKCCELLVWHL